MSALPDGPTLLILELVPEPQLRDLRLVCKRFKALVDAALTPSLTVEEASHLGGRLSRTPVYTSLHDFTIAAARVLSQRAEGLTRLVLDYDAYGCVFASQLLEQQPLPQLRCLELRNPEAQHVAMLTSLPRLAEVTIRRHINGPVTVGPASELLIDKLRGLPLRSLSMSGYRMRRSVLVSVASALPLLQQLTLGVEAVEHPDGRLLLACLTCLTQLQSLELQLLGVRASTPDVCVAQLPPEATGLSQLSSLALAHVRAAPGEEEALWSSLALLPALRRLQYEESRHAARQPPTALLTLSTLTSLHIKISGTIFHGDAPNSTWTQLPELPRQALPSLAHLTLDCVGLLSYPPSWCRLPLQSLYISGRARERSFYTLQLPDELPALSPTLSRLELPSCGLLALPEPLLQLTGLTYLSLARNGMVRLPPLGQLKVLAELELFGNPATNVAAALHGCRALRRLGIGSTYSARRCLAAGEYRAEAVAPASDDLEACRWQGAWLCTVRVALPWVPLVHATYPPHHN